LEHELALTNATAKTCWPRFLVRVEATDFFEVNCSSGGTLVLIPIRSNVDLLSNPLNSSKMACLSSSFNDRDAPSDSVADSEKICQFFALSLQADLAAQFAADFDDDPPADDEKKDTDTFKVPEPMGMDVDSIGEESSDGAGSDDDDEEARLAHEKALADAIRGASTVYEVTKLYNTDKLKNLIQVRF
jgi:hypothetical protein